MAFPILAGLAVGALMGGGIAALQKKDILQGALMGGIGGALGGAFMPGVAGALGGAAEGAAAGAAGAGSTAGATGAASLFPATSAGAVGTSGASSLFPATSAGALGAAPASSAASGIFAPGATGAMGGAAGGVGGAGAGSGMFSGGIGNFLTQNKYALAGGLAGGMMAPGKEPNPAEQGNIRDYTFSQDQNPLFGQPGQTAFTNQRYTPGAVTRVEDYKAANGGIIALAEGGQPGLEIQRYSQPVRQMAPEVAAYNNQLMERANQQYNVNLRPAPNQVPGSAGYVAPPAPKAQNAQAAGPKDYIDDYYQQMLGRNADPTGRQLIENAIKTDRGYDPARDIAESIRSSEEFKLSGKNANPTGIEIGKTYAANSSPSGITYNPQTGRYEGTFAAPGDKKKFDVDPATGAGMLNNNSWASGDGGANGGLMRSYNMGGLSSLGSYSDGGQLLKGPGDGVSDDIPAQIGRRQPARLADGEFVVPARIVSELGNGSTDAGAKRLYAMMDRVQKNRKKSIGKGKVAVDSKSRNFLPA